MTTSTSSASDAARTSAPYPNRLDLAAIDERLEALVTEITAPLSATALSSAFNTGVDRLSAILRSIPVHEGRLLERGISLIAENNPDLVVLTENLRLPVTTAAMQLVEKNAAHLYRTLTLDADAGGRKSYTPDLLVLNRRTKIAHVVDVKRSLSSYEVSRIAELKSRMLAAALIVPDLLYREHRRLVAEEVRVVIVNAESQRSDINGGIWPLDHLDHLLEVEGAGAAMIRMRQLFRDRIEANWSTAWHGLSAIRRKPGDTPHERSADNDGKAVVDDETSSASATAAANDDGKHGSPGLPRIGFARVPATALP